MALEKREILRQRRKLFSSCHSATCPVRVALPRDRPRAGVRDNVVEAITCTGAVRKESSRVAREVEALTAGRLPDSPRLRLRPRLCPSGTSWSPQGYMAPPLTMRRASALSRNSFANVTFYAGPALKSLLAAGYRPSLPPSSGPGCAQACGGAGVGHGGSRRPRGVLFSSTRARWDLSPRVYRPLAFRAPGPAPSPPALPCPLPQGSGCLALSVSMAGPHSVAALLGGGLLPRVTLRGHRAGQLGLWASRNPSARPWLGGCLALPHPFSGGLM